MFSTFEKIKELAQKRGISLQKVAEDMGYSVNYLYTLKEKTPKSDRLQEIADYFHVSTDYLLGRTDNPNIANGNSEIETPQFRSIQRKAKSLSVADQELLLAMMERTFQDVLSGGGDNEHNL
ncbi:helix-turn-helix domain-containing protein [Streptococcus anginosus]|uniref:helix-turn-helix domain-containing protein n=1 Tax=Streptococcus anginosus TaxID=1328 RepID=UPI0030812188|nr:helix-turn-helix domain-containing protein [Streptococcus anginosus]